MTYRLLILSVLLTLAYALPAQSFSVSTNVARWGTLGTMNVEAGYAWSQHLSLHVGVCVNPWTFRNSDTDDRYEDIMSEDRNPFQYKRESVAVSANWWPWHVFSGWWVRGKAQLMSYDRGGIFSAERRVGAAFGAGLGGGYSFMLSNNWNIDVGVTGWAGWTKEDLYERVNSTRPAGDTNRAFLWLDEVMVSLTYIF